MIELDCPVYLASGSPRRKEILSSIFSHFIVLSVEANEINDSIGSPEWISTRNAFRKLTVAKKLVLDERYLMITADTIVAIDNRILGKPVSRDEAIDVLHKLQNRTHQVYTGIALYYKQKKLDRFLFFSEKTEVTFNPIPDRDIESYVIEFKPFDKAGSYGIQELPDGFVKEINGDIDNVIGLPKLKLIEMIQKIIHDQNENPEK